MIQDEGVARGEEIRVIEIEDLVVTFGGVSAVNDFDPKSSSTRRSPD